MVYLQYLIIFYHIWRYMGAILTYHSSIKSISSIQLLQAVTSLMTSTGQRFSHFFGCMGGSRAAAPIGDKEWGVFRSFVRLSICPSTRPPSGPSGWLAVWLAVWASDLAGWASGLAGWPRGGEGRIDKWTENIPMLQDFVPYWSHCPKNKAIYNSVNCKWVGRGRDKSYT